MTEAEFRARVLPVGAFKWIEQLHPSDDTYDEKGIRRIGGKLNDSEDTQIQSVRFSKDAEHGWTEEKIYEWLDDNEFEINQLKSIKPKTYKKWEGREKKIDFEIISEFKIVNKAKFQEGKNLIVEGIINSDAVDAHEEIVAPEAVMESVPFFMEFPTFRYMHEANSLGVVLKIWKVGNKVWARMRIDSEEEKIIKKVLKGTLKAFSIGFRALKVEQFCPEKDSKGNLKCFWKFVKIMLIEISLVDTPANRDAKLVSSRFKSLMKSLMSNQWVKDAESDEYKTTAMLDKPAIPPKISNADDTEECNVCASIDLEDDDESTKSIVNIHKKVINKPATDIDDNQLKLVRRDETMTDKKKKATDDDKEIVDEEEEIVDDVDVEDSDDTTVTTDDDTTDETEEETPDEKVLKVLAEIQKSVDCVSKRMDKFEMSEDERKEADALEAKVAEKMKVETDKRKAAEDELEKMKAEKVVADEVAKQMGKLPPTKRSLSSDGEPSDDVDEELPNIEPSKVAAYRKAAEQLRSYTNAPPIEEDE